MDFISIELNKLYNAMQDEIFSEIYSLGGEVIEFDPDDRVVSISVAPDLREHAEHLIADIIQKYIIKKKELCGTDSFYGIKQLLKDN